MLVDSHCHLDFPDFVDDLDGVLARATTAGVGWMQTICTRLRSFDGVVALAERNERLFCSVGVHPHHVAEETEPVTPEVLLARAKHPKVIGLGETGLDFYYEQSPRDQQEASFRAHIVAARRSGLPIIVHTRTADTETIRIMREEAERGRFPGVIHCFTAGRAVAQCALELGLYVSLAGILTFKNAGALRDVVRDLPLDRLLVETDSPYLAPVPHRGKRNEPAFVPEVAAALATLKGISAEQVAQTTTDNFFRLFSKARRYPTNLA
ncbi:MAG: TatD family deoxyribonuclease [Alphaproteobacteria bacterium]|nr:TatD family deoxyribonuclease [Alphaproteobacteria bacterium]